VIVTGMLGATMRIHRPAADVLAFYDGRVPGAATDPDWRGFALALGIASYAVVAGDEALVYDSHMSPAHAAIVRGTLRDLGVRRFTLVLSHWHRDHVAGNEVFADGPILAQPLTFEFLAAERAVIEAGTPPIAPLVMPNRTVADGEVLRVGGIDVVVRHFDVHSRDGTVLVLPDRGLMFAGDTLEDPVTYVSEPDRLEAHLAGLDRIAALGVARILPNHGAEARIAAGGFGPELIDATRAYVEGLLRCRDDPVLAALPLEEFIAGDLASGAVEFFAPYAKVHADNVAKVVAARA
jgi:cyclase